MRLHRVGVNWNPQANCSVRLSDLPPCALRVNVIHGLPVPMSEMVSAGHTVLLQVGTEALHRYIDPRTDWQSYLDSYLRCWRDLITTFDDTVAAFETFNEPNDWQGSTSAILTPLQFAELQTEAYRIAKERGAFCVSGPILSHDWSGGAVGYDYLLQAFPSGKVPADAIGLHLYLATPEAMAERALDWRDKCSQPLILSEFGFEGRDQHVSLSFAVLQPRVAASQLFCLQSWRDNAGLHDWGIVDEHGHRKASFADFYAMADTARDQYLTGGESVPTYPTITQKTAFFFSPSKQKNTAVAKVPDRPDLASTEYDMQLWLGNTKIIPLAKQLHPDWYCQVLDFGPDTGSQTAKLRQAYTWLVGCAKANPNTTFVCVDGHTDDTGSIGPHHGYRALGAASRALGEAIGGRMKQVWQTTAHRWDGEGYIALGGSETLRFPFNLVSVIYEEYVHTQPEHILAWVNQCDAIAWAIVTGVGDYVKPVSMDWQQMYEAEKKRADGLAAKIAAAKAALA